MAIGGAWEPLLVTEVYRRMCTIIIIVLGDVGDSYHALLGLLRYLFTERLLLGVTVIGQ